MREMCRIVHNDYNRISDKVMWLSPEYLLKFNVDLYINRQARSQNDKSRSNFHKEIGYTFDNEHRVKINRDFTYYLSIEPTRNNGPNRKVNIGPKSIYFLKYKLETVIESWFSNNNSPFSRQNGHLFIPTDPGSIKVLLDFDGYLEFEPTVLQINGQEMTGVKIFVNNDNDFFMMPIDNFLSFKYCIDNFNLYQSAQLMLNYVGRPDNGTNYIEMQPAEAPKGFFNRVAQQYDPNGG